MSLQNDVGQGLELESSDLSEDAYQMMNNPHDRTGGSFPSPVIYCGRCGKPKDYSGDYGHWETDRPPWCTCPPIEKFVSGQFKPQGWECPKCKRVYAPHINECEKCNNVRLVSITLTNDYDSEDDLSSSDISEMIDALGLEIEDDESN